MKKETESTLSQKYISLNTWQDKQTKVGAHIDLHNMTYELDLLAKCKHCISQLQNVSRTAISRNIKKVQQFPRLEIMHILLWEHNSFKQEINNKRIIRKPPNTWKLSTILLNNSCIKEEISMKINSIFKQMKI
jgi:predicted DNA-binding protein YlxM (UPF0122 family)